MQSAISRRIEPDSGLVTQFFNLATVGQLRDFVDALSPSIPFEQALARYARSWTQLANLHPDAPYSPGRFISRDLSAALLGNLPCIFMGTNFWASKRFMTHDEILLNTHAYENRIREIGEVRSHNLAFVMVPEKDVVIDVLRGELDSLGVLPFAMQRFRNSAGSMPFIFDQLFEQLPAWASADDYAFPDSHLLSRDYFILFEQLLVGFGIHRPSPGAILFESEPFYGDLHSKFDTRIDWLSGYNYPRFRHPSAKFEQSGSASFESPLADTVQHFRNPDPIINASLEIFGDSHSSIIASKKMTYLLAHTFRETTFYWNPYCVRGGEMKFTADFVLMEISQRFVV